jgi:hypothetical protein
MRQRPSRTTDPLTLILASAGLFLMACGANERILKSGKETPLPGNAAATATTAEQDVEDMRTADFRFIYVIRRHDGGLIDPDDKAIIRVQTAEMNRRVSSDGGRAIVIGSNYELVPERTAALGSRFAIEDRSPVPIVDPAGPANTGK